MFTLSPDVREFLSLDNPKNAPVQDDDIDDADEKVDDLVFIEFYMLFTLGLFFVGKLGFVRVLGRRTTVDNVIGRFQKEKSSVCN